MQDKRSAEIKVGIVSLVALVLLVAGIILGKGMVLSKTIPIKIRFPNSGGIQATSPVLVNGVKRGTVGSVKNDNGSVLITVDLDNTDDIYSDVSARITILEVTGGKKIEIFPGKSGNKFNVDNEIIGETPADIADLVAVAGGMVNELTAMVKRLDTIAVSVNTILSDGEVNSKLRKVLNNSDQITEDLKMLINNNKGNLASSLKDAKDIVADLKVAVKNNEPKIAKLIDNLDEKVNGLGAFLKKTENGLNNVDAVLGDLKAISSEIKSGKGAANKLIFDKKFAEKIDSTINILNNFIKTVHKKGINANVRLGGRD